MVKGCEEHPVVTVIAPTLAVLLGFPHPAVLAGKEGRVGCWLAQKSAAPDLMSGHLRGEFSLSFGWSDSHTKAISQPACATEIQSCHPIAS